MLLNYCSNFGNLRMQSMLFLSSEPRRLVIGAEKLEAHFFCFLSSMDGAKVGSLDDVPVNVALEALQKQVKELQELVAAAPPPPAAQPCRAKIIEIGDNGP